MSIIHKLGINQLRNIGAISLEPSSKINFFYGENGSGKTSILEAIALLGLGRSFRSHKSRSLIQHETTELTVFAEVSGEYSPVPVGIQKRTNGKTDIKMNGDAVHSASLLAKQLPLQIINAASFLLIEGSPGQRRQFLDWMVFHVKPEFSTLWKALQKLLKQRNSLLRRDKIDYSVLEPWDLEFVRLAENIDALRKEVFTLFLTEFQQLEYNTEIHKQIQLEYNRGWDHQVPFSECLKADFERDKRDGYSHHGPQRADIMIRVNNKPAAEVLSRGQEKSLISALHIAQAYLYLHQTQQHCVFLIDDLLAELDTANAKQLAKWLTALDGQVFITGVSRDDLEKAWENEGIDHKTFHVKHGTVEQVTKF